jgi:hypothetical protein
VEYLLGGFVTLLGVAILYYVIAISNKNFKTIRIKSSQSRTYDILAPFIIPVNRTFNKKRQSINHLESTQIRILMLNDKAYWIKDNAVYSATLNNGIIMDESTKVVDIMGMNEVELEEMMFIIERLTEGKSNDYRSSGDS